MIVVGDPIYREVIVIPLVHSSTFHICVGIGTPKPELL
jgi:hypothetical protein